MGNEQSQFRIVPDMGEEVEELARKMALMSNYGGIYRQREELTGKSPPPEVKTPEEVRLEIRSRSDSIFDNYETLSKILQRHEETIQNRWQKKSRQQSLVILLSAWPDMTSSHRPDFDVFLKGSENAHDYDGVQRDRFLCPFINQEDLLVPKAPLLLLNARVRNPASLFAAADIDAMKLGSSTGRVNGLTENTHEYGKLIARKYHPEDFDGHVNKRQCINHDGLLLPEAQDRLLEVLVHCCHQILKDIPQATLIGDSFPILSEPELKSEVTSYESLVLTAAEAPYRIPAQPDFSLVLSMLAARVSALEDHLWALREDPGYFTTQILEIKEHQLQNLKDQSGKDHPLLLDSQQHKLLAHVMRIPMTEAYWYLEIFSEARRLAKRVAVLQRKYATDITPEKDLPEEYLQALLLFHHFLDRVPDLLQATLWNAAPASPPLRRLFYRQPSRSKTEDIHVWYNTKKLEKEDTVQHQLLWSIMYLWKDNEVLSLTAMPVLVDELERLLRSEPRARAMLTPFVSAALGDLSIIAQCLHQSKLYQPWAWTWESSLVKRREELEKRYFQRFEAFSRHIIILDDDAMSKAGTLCDFPSGKFAYPFGKPHTKANIEALRSAERRLDAVWAVFDNAQSR